MYETVIWATDGPYGADAALEEGLRLAGPCPVLAIGPRSELNAVLHHASTGVGA
jgi:hypothetical protein